MNREIDSVAALILGTMMAITICLNIAAYVKCRKLKGKCYDDECHLRDYCTKYSTR